MLIGLTQHSLDEKGRLIIPQRFRRDLGERFVATRGLDGCISLYPLEEWDRLSAIIRSAPIAEGRTMQRFFFGFAEELQPDSQNRVLLSAKLRNLAGLKKEVVLVGVETRVEVWNLENWEKIENSVTDEDVLAALSSSNV